jgi:FKBP-type peptidyl-prolyl cis-trans isomerase FkpA
MRTMLMAAAASLLLSPEAARAAEPPIRTDDQKTVYAIGRQIGQGVRNLALSPQELEILKRGLSDAYRGVQPPVSLDRHGPAAIEAFTQKRNAIALAREEERGRAYLEKAARQKGALRLPSGLVFKELKPGTGASPSTGDWVKVHLRGRLVDGTVVDDSYAQSKPLQFQIHPRVIPCWTEGVQRMKVGGKARVVCPASRAFRDRGRPPAIPGGATVIYEFELLSVEKDSTSEG